MGLTREGVVHGGRSGRVDHVEVVCAGDGQHDGRLTRGARAEAGTRAVARRRRRAPALRRTAGVSAAPTGGDGMPDEAAMGAGARSHAKCKPHVPVLVRALGRADGTKDIHAATPRHAESGKALRSRARARLYVIRRGVHTKPCTGGGGRPARLGFGRSVERSRAEGALAAAFGESACRRCTRLARRRTACWTAVVVRMCVAGRGP